MKKKSRSLRYKLDYVTFWNQKGYYGEIRVSQMRKRKQRRYEKWVERKQRRGYFYDKRNGCMRQVCDYQPLGSLYITYCDYPCNGDC